MTVKRKNNMNKQVLLLLLVCLIFIPVFTFTSYYLLREDAGHKDQSSSRVQQDSSLNTSSVTPSPNPKSEEPSERALAAAAYLFANADQNDINSFYEKSGVDNPFDAIRYLAIKLDAQPERLAYFEAVIDKHKRGTSHSSDFIDETLNISICQSEWAEYNTCVLDFNAKQSEYQTCMSGNFSQSCIQPLSTNFCLKPTCSL